MNKLIVAVPLSVALVACGGGGSGGSPSTPSAVASGKVEYAAYAAPSGPICSQTSSDPALGEYCLEPTSSSATPEQVLAYLRDPHGKLVKFEATGFRWTAAPFFYEYHGVESRDLYIGGGRITSAGLTYGPSFKNLDITPNSYLLTTGNDSQQLSVTVGDALDFLQLVQQDLTPYNGGPAYQFDAWYLQQGLRTDWADAPTETTVLYTGAISITGYATKTGGVAHLPDGRDVDAQATASCPITAKLNVLTSQISVTVGECTGGSDGAGVSTASFGGTELIFDAKASRISAHYVLPTNVKISNSDLGVDVSETIADVAGGIYGSQARSIYIEGHSPRATISVAAYRNDLVSTED